MRTHLPLEPLGGLHPPARARVCAGVRDHLLLEVVARADATASVDLSLHFLQHGAHSGQVVERTWAAPAWSLAELAVRPFEQYLPARTTQDPLTGTAPLDVQCRVEARWLAPGMAKVRVRILNRTAVAGADERALLRGAMLSTHLVLRLGEGSFVSPLETEGALGAAARGCTNINTWPVLASPDDAVVLGAATLLPEHPERRVRGASDSNRRTSPHRPPAGAPGREVFAGARRLVREAAADPSPGMRVLEP